ncbi:MAG TPA: ATP-binding protein, partial [Terracidiphilus sp.]|nr:ATP-binding protein [Terracidiphilus sp.]
MSCSAALAALDIARQFLEVHSGPGPYRRCSEYGFGRPTLIVRDSGIGISAAALPYIFDRFYRADPSRSQVEGSGLGLAIAKWIADSHHADLLV